MGVKSLYNLGDRKFRSVGEKMLEWGPCPKEAEPLGPRLSSSGERERNAVMAIRVGGQYVAVLFSLQLTSYTVKPLVTLSKPLSEKYIFLKNCVRSLLLCWICFCIYMCMYNWLWLYNNIAIIIFLKIHHFKKQNKLDMTIWIFW